jgi:hypothetical protein
MYYYFIGHEKGRQGILQAVNVTTEKHLTP